MKMRESWQSAWVGNSLVLYVKHKIRNLYKEEKILKEFYQQLNKKNNLAIQAI